jgi:hypothetical protein
MRTVWLALICLIGVGIMAAIKITTSSRATTNVAERVGLSERQEPKVSLTQGVATPDVARREAEQHQAKSDRLSVLNVDVPATVPQAPPAALGPGKPRSDTVEPSIKLVSRHWRDPLAPKTEPLMRKGLEKTSPRKASRRQAE